MKFFDIPILFLIFNKPETSLRVFSEIRKVKPKKLYIGCDGPRNFIKNESHKVLSLQESIINQIDWDCEVKTFFRDTNYGCRIAVSDAITWFFNSEEKGIILEDDCLPCESFFNFSKHMLKKYENDYKIWHISGTNLFSEQKIKGDYYFSKIPLIWGWATWASRWKHYHEKRQSFNSNGMKVIRNLFNRKEASFWYKTISNSHNIDAWDADWAFCCFSNKGYSIQPKKNLISNIGFGDEARTTKDIDHELASLETFELLEPYDFNKEMLYIGESLDSQTMRTFFSISFKKTIQRKIKSIYKRLRKHEK